MNRDERRARARQQAKTSASLKKRANRPASAQEALAASQGLFQLGRGRDALPGLREAVALYPDNPDLHAALAYALASNEETGEARDHYRRVLDLQPDNVRALTNLAFLLSRTGDFDEARRRLERAAALSPGDANTAYALADLLVRQQRKEEAFHQYRRAAALFRNEIGPKPGIERCNELIKLGTAQMFTGDPEGGLRSLDLAVELRPDHAHALSRRALALVQLRRVPEAIATLKRAAAAAPDLAQIRRTLGELYFMSGADGPAQREYAAANRIDPGDEMAQYLLAATRQESPESPPPAYIRELFNDYAHRFESHLVEVLRYRAPEIVCEAVLKLAGPQAPGWEVIDLGCGTGLCGPLIRRAAHRLTGVDLSEAMLCEARKKSVYDELKLGDAVQVLGSYDGVFDLALCTDVMIYIGSLTPLFAAAGRALKSGALFAFTTEVHAGEGFVLDRTLRYLHSRSYVETEVAAHGFTVIHFEPIVARFQSKEADVHNLFIVRREARTPAE